MKINKILFKTYGKIIDKEVFLEDGLNIFVGENESGKSTIFNSIYSALFGFKPTNRDKHPYTNWDKNELNFSVEISNSKELFLVERSLKSVPKLNLVELNTGTVQTLRNEPLPFINHVSEGMFEKVFYLSADDLNNIEKDTWEAVQEKLIFNYGSDYLQKTSEVLFALEQDINALWRKDKRGNPLINQLLTEIGQLKLKRAETEEYHDLLRREIKKLELLQSEQLSLEQIKEEREQELKWLRKMMPIKDLVDKIQSLNMKIYKKNQFENLNQNLLLDMKNIEGNLEKKRINCDQLLASISEVKLQIVPMSAHDEKLFELSSELETLKSLQSELVRLEQEEHSKLEDVIKLSEKVETLYKLLFGEALEEGVKVNLKKVQVLDLIALLQKYSDGIEKNQANKAQMILQGNASQKNNFLIAAFGLVLTIIGFIYKPLQLISFIGIGCVGYSLANFSPTKKVKSIESVDLVSLHKQIIEATHGIKLPEYVYREDSQRFLSKLEQLITLLYEEELLHEKREKILNQKKVLERQLALMFKHVELDVSRDVRLTLQFALLQIDTLIQANEIEKSKLMKLNLLEENYQQASLEFRNIQVELEQIYETILNFSDGNLQLGIEQIQRNLEIQNSIKVFQDELSNYQYNKDELSKVEILDIERLESDINLLQRRDKELTEITIQLKGTIQELKNKVNLESIESEILYNEEALKDAIKRRDELMVAYEIIKWSDEQFKVKNQPNIIHRVSHFMSIMTQKKYSQVIIKEENNQYELQFLVNGELMSANRAFSKGTKQQLYFAYRLAVLEALDPEYQMPLVLDEALINWDQNRFNETLKILSELSKDRQIFFFTCHKALAMQMNTQLSANLIEVNS